ncbi:MAG: hypothetical protein OEV40_16035 [Acidimicrobiia bacterium]|nr:hypothetical protein [Acidimicrobiia bacterium]
MRPGTTFPGAAVSAWVASARADVANEQVLDQSRCVDWLLDCLNAARRPTVRAIICEALAGLSQARTVAGAEFRLALDHVDLALQVDAAFDHLDLTAS